MKAFSDKYDAIVLALGIMVVATWTLGGVDWVIPTLLMSVVIIVPLGLIDLFFGE